MIGIIGAMSVEIEKIKSTIQDKKEMIVSGITFASGKIHEKDVVVAVCGIGKVFAATCAQTMILKFNPEVILNIGVAGTLTNKLGIADIAIADNMVQHDMDTSPIGDPVGLISGINIIQIPCSQSIVDIIEKCVDELGIHFEIGTIASGDQFVVDKNRKDRIVKEFDAIACEMEGAAIGQVCYINKVDYAVIRAISDSADGNSHMDYAEFTIKAAENSTKVINQFIHRYQ
ncbi:MAG TPA: 5'-methylthioadenosine/adenosylhomocysteine nucleosidase [Lachnospiraceae bacterium]|nr:5'-methylthioadenosine/adenosylhomocysteine nucleosidase [Lachnospiraceae bacterium]